MSRALLVVSYLRELNTDFVRILQTVRDAPDFSFRVVACQTATGLYQAVGNAFGGTRQIGRLDIHGHATRGMQAIGDEVFADQQADVLWRLVPYLTDDAEVRLIGCANALGPECFAMLHRLQRTYPGFTIFGCTSPSVKARDFDERGLRDAFARKWLVPVWSLTHPLQP